MARGRDHKLRDRAPRAARAAAVMHRTGAVNSSGSASSPASAEFGRSQTPLGFTTRQITNAYRLHEPTSGLGLPATLVFATESNSWTASAHTVESKECEGWLDPANSLHRALMRLGRALGTEKGAALNGAAKGLPM
jgi:hypothetical protein